MLTYFLIWFALGLYGFTYLMVLDYLDGINIEISVGNIFLFVAISGIFGGIMTLWSMGHTLPKLFSFMGKPLVILKRKKE